MSTPRLYRRILRHETHPSRTLPTIVAAVAVIAVLAWLGTEIVLHLFGRPALLAAPAQIVGVIVKPRSLGIPVLAAGGGALAVLGLLAIAAALLPGRRARPARTTERSAIVIDDRIIASAFAREAAQRSGTAVDQVRAGVGKHAAIIRSRATSGLTIDRDRVSDGAAANAVPYEPAASLRTRVTEEQNGMVGA